MSDYLAFFCTCRDKMKNTEKPFHLTSHCDYWHWWNPITMSRWCIPCIYMSLYTFSRLNFTPTLSCSFCNLFLPVLQDLVMRMGPGGGSCPHLDFMGHRFWGLLTLPVQWTPNEILSLLILLPPALSWVPCMKCVAVKLDYLSKSSWLLAGVCDASCYPVDRSVTKGPLGADTDTCFTLNLWFSWQLPLHTRKTREREVRMYFQL